jgi:pentatricopeptide repeat protein
VRDLLALPLGSVTDAAFDKAEAILDGVKRQLYQHRHNNGNSNSNSNNISNNNSNGMHHSEREVGTSDASTSTIVSTTTSRRSSTTTNSSTIDVDAVNASLNLLERLVREMSMAAAAAGSPSNAFAAINEQQNDTLSSNATNNINNINIHRAKRICTPRYFNPLFNAWKETALLQQQQQHTNTNSNGGSVAAAQQLLSAKDLVKKLQTMSTLLPEFRYNIATISMIMHVVIKTHPNVEKAPLVAERLLDFVWSESALTANADLAPNSLTYGLILTAWAESGLPQAAQRMHALVDEMHHARHIPPNIVTYNILLRYWANKRNVERMHQVLDMVQRDGLEPGVLSLAQALFCYAKVGQTADAAAILDCMLQLRGVVPVVPTAATTTSTNDIEFDDKAVAESVQNLMIAYREAVVSAASSNEKKTQAVADAEALVAKIQQMDAIGPGSFGTNHRTNHYVTIILECCAVRSLARILARSRMIHSVCAPANFSRYRFYFMSSSSLSFECASRMFYRESGEYAHGHLRSIGQTR